MLYSYCKKVCCYPIHAPITEGYRGLLVAASSDRGKRQQRAERRTQGQDDRGLREERGRQRDVVLGDEVLLEEANRAAQTGRELTSNLVQNGAN